MAKTETQRPIICFGDSYTEGHGADSSEAYPAHLERALGLPVINAGVSGETAGEGLRRFESDVLGRDPALVIVEFGVNEAFRGYPMEESLRNLGIVVARLRKKNIPVVLVGVHFREFQENFDEGIKKISERYGTGLVLNVLEGILGNPSLQSDAYHPNAEGYRLMFERILPEVKKNLPKRAGEKGAG